MRFSIFRHLRRSKKNQSSDPRPVFFTLGQLTTEKMKLQQDLYEAVDTITSLRAQLAEYDFLLAHFQSRESEPAFAELQLEETPSSSHSSQISPKTSTIPTWIDDIWLCSGNDSPLKDAEDQWEDDCPEFALSIASHAICSDPFLSPAEEMRCRVFVAAVLHSLGRYEESNQRVEVLLQMISRHYLFDGPHSKDITGIAHFIQGRNLMALNQVPEAYWSLSRALSTPGYHTKARDYQKKAIEEFTRNEAANGSASPTVSLRPLLSWIDSESSICSDSVHQLDVFLTSDVHKNFSQTDCDTQVPAASGLGARTFVDQLFCVPSTPPIRETRLF
ncbi:hypothetical protein NUU61_004246 [Penicillium alfredii]|uniref:Uncharacterized protein n=1 Tax=Penicillium alfredii TaxID=1506179 RepID=A0A9W9FKR2_9EURO|nr:uncharacterized protein NUU61_004246 [Penicillium alfredii]KAJ5102024.1 hypothetical protein NUU61_004246 [Penicillium alfredii]